MAEGWNKSLGFTLWVLTIVAMIWFFVIWRTYWLWSITWSWMDLLQIWKYVWVDNWVVYLWLFAWGLILWFMVIPFTTFAQGQSSLMTILWTAFDNWMNKLSRLGVDVDANTGQAATQEEKNTLILSFMIYTFLILGILTVLYFFMNTFGYKFLNTFSWEFLSQNGWGWLISWAGFFWDAIKNLIWAYAWLIFLSFVMNMINKNVILKSLEDNKLSWIEFLKSILLIICVIWMSYWAVNALDVAKNDKNIWNVIWIGVQWWTTDTTNTDTTDIDLLQ